MNKSTDTEFNTVGKKSGEKAHTLTATEMPSHNHPLGSAAGGNVGYAEAGGTPNQYTVGFGVTRTNNDVRTGYVGGSQAHNNIQPSITVTRAIKY